jgi:hypothetical protein
MIWLGRLDKFKGNLDNMKKNIIWLKKSQNDIFL